MTLEWTQDQDEIWNAREGSLDIDVYEGAHSCRLELELDVGSIEEGKKLAEQVLALVNGTPRCHACGSTRTFITKFAHDTFEPREGCLDCNTWQTPVRLRSDT